MEGGENSESLVSEPTASEELKVKLTSNPLLDKLAFVFVVAPLETDKAIERASEVEAYKEQGIVGTKRATGILMEAHVDLVLERFASENFVPENPERIQLNPIKPGESTNSFKFVEETTGNIKALKKKTEEEGVRAVTDYDQIIVIDGLPTLIQVKSTKYQTNQEGEYRGILDLEQRPQRLNRIFEPLKEYFKTDTFGYLIVCIQESDEAPPTIDWPKNKALISAISVPQKKLTEGGRELRTKLLQEKATKDPE